MDDLHQRFEAWLLDGAAGDPPRDLAVHAALCPECAEKVAAFDALAAVDVATAGVPPPLAPTTLWEAVLVYLRIGGAAAGAILAGVLVVIIGGQFIDLGSPGPSSDSSVTETPTLSAEETQVVSNSDSHTPTPTPSASPTPVGSWEVPATPPPRTPTPLPTPTRAPTPSPGASIGPTPVPTPVPTPAPTALPTAVPTPVPTPTPTVPGTPSLSSSLLDTTITITWTTPSSGGSAILGYRVYRGTSSGADTLLTTLGTQTSLSDDPGLASGPYYYRVAAFNTVGEGSKSNETSEIIP